MLMLTCIKQHLSNIQSSIHKKIKQHWDLCGLTCFMWDGWNWYKYFLLCTKNIFISNITRTVVNQKYFKPLFYIIRSSTKPIEFDHVKFLASLIRRSCLERISLAVIFCFQKFTSLIILQAQKEVHNTFRGLRGIGKEKEISSPPLI